MPTNSQLTWVRKTIKTSIMPRVKLHHLQNLVPRKHYRMLGRGTGGGRGDSCGRGNGGQRHTNRRAIRLGFEGGQPPFYLRAKKHGISSQYKKDYQELNLAVLQHHINKGRIDTSKTITMKVLQDAGIVGQIKDGVKLLDGGGDWLSSQIKIEVTKASKSAIERVEALGGHITTVYFNKLNLRAHLRPELFDTIPRSALPTKRDMLYYLNPDKRGYLLTKEGRERLREGGLTITDDGELFSLTKQAVMKLKYDRAPAKPAPKKVYKQ